MAAMPLLQDLLELSSGEFPDRVAIKDPNHGQLTYMELKSLSGTLCERFREHGLEAGDRVGMCLYKSLGGIVTQFAALKAGAAYVPVDASAPVARNNYIFKDCGVRALVIESQSIDAMLAEWEGDSPIARERLDLLADYGLDLSLLIFAAEGDDTAVPDDLAYILYTSGSTGKPKGVMHSHSSALGFINWCLEEFMLSEEDRFSSHAPFHFDLSIFDIFVSLSVGACLVIIDEATGKQPVVLAEFVQQQEISVFYATPSILRLLVEFGKLGERNYSCLRLVLFAGETYTLNQYLELKQYWSSATYYNLYGPTETNVCTFYQVPGDIASGAYDYFPIGLPSSGDQVRIIEENKNEDVIDGESGELVVTGASVMSGYWNLPERNAEAFVEIEAQRWYRTGDIVVSLADGNINYLSRRDRMIKRRGYRVELGEIESALYRMENCVEAAAVAFTNPQGDVIVKAFLVVREGSKHSIIALKTYCAANLISYMIPDQFAVLTELPKTSTDKVDYQKLKEM